VVTEEAIIGDSFRFPRRRGPRLLVAVLVAVALGAWATACGQGDDGGDTGTSVVGDPTLSGDREVGIGVPVAMGSAQVTVRALQDAFQPAPPSQRLSDATPVAPAAGESFYQAYVLVENRGQMPLRVDPEDFGCLIGNQVSTVEPTRSGPPGRSLIFGTSMDLVLTFRGPAGQDPVLVYSPHWYDGVIAFSAQVQTAGTTTTVLVQ
jgi:hypothetical protein